MDFGYLGVGISDGKLPGALCWASSLAQR